MSIMEYNGDTISNKELEANISFLFRGQMPPSSPLLPKQKQQEVVEQDKGDEENVALLRRYWSKAVMYKFELLAPANYQ